MLLRLHVEWGGVLMAGIKKEKDAFLAHPLLW